MKLIVAVNEEWGIGCEGELLSRIPDDMAFFKQKTMGKVVIMGNSTFKSLPESKPLKNRINIIMSKDTTLRIRGAIVCNSLKDIIYVSNMCHTDDVFIIGGQSIYEQFLPYCSIAYVTKIVTRPPQKADKYFPNLDAMPSWKLVETSEKKYYRNMAYNFTIFENNGLLSTVNSFS